MMEVDDNSMGGLWEFHSRPGVGISCSRVTMLWFVFSRQVLRIVRIVRVLKLIKVIG